MKDLISIIIPVYKTEKYLSKCIESIINQTYKNLEIILIDDGSPDNCGKICDDYAQKDKRIRVLHKKNGGLSAVRNDGIAMANGEYITFVDSDDFISEYYCENMLNAIKRNNADIAICKLYSFKENEYIIEKNIEYVEESFNTDELISNYIKMGSFYDCMGGKIFASKLFDKIKFPVGRVYEDAATIYKIYTLVENAVVLNQEYYYYLRREGSITMSVYNSKNQNDDYLLVTEKYKFLKENLPEMNELINSLYIKNIMTVIQTSYLANDENLIDSEIFIELDEELRKTIKIVDKNILSEVLNYYRLACLYLYLQNRKVYISNIKELYNARYDNNNF